MVTKWEGEGQRRIGHQLGGGGEEWSPSWRGEGGYDVVESGKQGKGMELVKECMRLDWL